MKGQAMKKLAFALVIGLGLLAGMGASIGQYKIPADAIRTSVTRTEALLDRAWRLPVATTFAREIVWQSNGSACGPASLANVFRSLGEAPDTEGGILEGTSACWFHVCPVGLTLDQAADLARLLSSREVDVLRDLTPEAFGDILRDVNNPGRCYIHQFQPRADLRHRGRPHLADRGISGGRGSRVRSRRQRELPSLAGRALEAVHRHGHVL